MAYTTVATGLSAKKWDDKFFTEYLTENRYTVSMGSDENSIIQIKESLGKQTGDQIVLALVNRMKQQAITGATVLEGNEEDLVSRSMGITITKRRNAFIIPEMVEIQSAINLREGGRSVLKDWAQKDTESLLSEALMSIDGVSFATASAAQKNTWLNNNYTRTQFGKLRSNNGTAGSAVFATALATLDPTDDLLTPAAVSVMKQLAVETDPKITPIRVDAAKGRRYYVMYANSRSFRDLKNNSDMKQAQREVTLEVENNRLFEGGDLLWDGVVVKEIPDLLGAAGYQTNTNSVVCGPVFLCGGQALGLVYGKRWRTIVKQFDYDDKYAVAIDAIYGVRKIIFGTGSGDTDNPVDNGVITGWFACPATA